MDNKTKEKKELTEEEKLCRKLFTMKMNETVDLVKERLNVRRVPGGWIYEYWKAETGGSPHSTQFVGWDYMDYNKAHKASYEGMNDEDDDLPF